MVVYVPAISSRKLYTVSTKFESFEIIVLCCLHQNTHRHGHRRTTMNVNQQSNETMVPIKENQASHYALHVALQTMKERCLALQQRLTSVEEENLALRLKYGTDTPNSRSGMLDTNDMNRSEIDQLRDKVGELTRQKHQLTEHIGMVASENRQLWSRLSKLTKDNQTLGISLNKIKDTLTSSGMPPAHQNLIRSKTFTQNSPNPILRQKLLQDQYAVEHAKSSDNVSMEEIILKDLDDTKDADVNAMMRPSHPTVDQSNKVANSLGFGYLNDESMNTILQNETKKCLEDMVEIKRELLRQQSDLKVTVSAFRQRRGMFICSIVMQQMPLLLLVVVFMHFQKYARVVRNVQRNQQQLIKLLAPATKRLTHWTPISFLMIINVIQTMQYVIETMAALLCLFSRNKERALTFCKRNVLPIVWTKCVRCAVKFTQTLQHSKYSKSMWNRILSMTPNWT